MNAVTQPEPAREVAVESPKELSLGAQLKAKESNFVAALPAHMPVERFMRVILTAIQNAPELQRADRQSLWNACMRAAQDGLLPDGREGALVIYKTKDGDRWIAKVQWMPMIAGVRKKVRNSGEIKDWNAQVVHAKDHFEFELGDEPYIKHKPYLGADDPGPVIAAYSVAQFKSGELSREVMTRAQIDKVRSASKSEDKGPWVDWFEEMARKTVARRHAKILPMSTDLDDLMRRDDELYDLGGKSDKQLAAPPKSLGERLDMLAGPDAPSTVMHDPETGEVIEQDRPAADGDAPAKDSPAPAADDRQKALLADLAATGEARAAAGPGALQEFLDGLNADERALIPSAQATAWREKAAKVAR